MKILPYERYELNVPLTPAEVNNVLSNQVKPGSLFGMGPTPFIGEVELYSFKIHRAIGYSNSFLPIVSGRVKDVGGRSKISVTLRMSYFTIAFMYVWMGFVAVACISTYLKNDGKSISVSLGMLLFAYVLSQAGFWFEAPRAKRFLKELFLEHKHQVEFQ